MGYTNSGLVAYKKLSPNHSGQRTHSIDRITPHCVVGQCSAEGLGDWFAKSSTQASSNYGIDKDGRVGLYVEEKNRSWCSSSNANDQRAVTIECASDTTEPYAFRDVVYKKLITLCVDICRRNGKKKLLWFGDKDKTLNYSPKSDEMVLTVHRWFANKSCIPVDSEVLTKDGWVKLRDIQIGDEIACADLENLRITFEEVYDKVPERDQDTYTNNGFTATKDHRCVYRGQYQDEYRIDNYKHLLASGQSFYIPLAGYAENDGINLTDDELRFLVAVQADGHYMHEKRTPDDPYIGLEFHLKKERKIQRIKELLKSCHFEYNENYKSDGSVSIRIYGKDIVDECEKHLTDKCFNWGWLQMSRHQAEVFLDELLLWDGCTAANLYTSKQQVNLDVVSAVAALNGYGSNVSGSNIQFRQEPFITFGRDEESTKRNCRRSGTDKTRVSCVSVKTGIFLIRQNGKTFITGNCPGNWMYARMGDLASKVTAQLGGSSSGSESTSTPATSAGTNTKFPAVPFLVTVIIDDLNIRTSGSMSGKVVGQTGKGVFTIVEVKNGWGKLKSGAGWIYLENASYCTIGKTVSSGKESPQQGEKTEAEEKEEKETGLQATTLKNLSEADVIKKVGALFTADQKKSGILASVSLAQFILESGYGKSELAQNANNCFGMKKSLSGNTWSGSAWDGKSVYTKKTGEQNPDGSYVTITADFRKYPCVEDSIADHSAYLLGAMNGSKQRYAGLKGCTDYKTAAQIIKDGGYATSLTYVDKLCDIIQRWNLTQYDVKAEAATVPEEKVTLSATHAKYINSTGTHYISNSGHDENNAYRGGQAGDQTGTEWQMRSWYNRPWTVVLRYPDQKVALKIAQLGIDAALNDKIGYDQGQNRTYLNQLKAAGWEPSKITTPCEADCSAGVCANVTAAGYLLGIPALQTHTGTYTGNMKNALVKAGFKALTDSKYLTSGNYLLPGDILLNENHHTATNVTIGSKVKTDWKPTASTPTNPAAPTKYYRVRKSWEDKVSQIGAYTVLENAILAVDANPGYAAFDDDGKQVYPEKKATSFTKYPLTDTQLLKIARLCKQEQGTVAGAKAEASLMANQLETSASRRKKYGTGADGLYNWVRNGGWFARAAHWMDNGSVSEAVLAGVKDVLVNGNRTLPLFVDEHDCLSDIKSISTGSVKDRSAYVQGKTVVKNKYGSTWTFWCFPDSTSDPFGYTAAAYKAATGEKEPEKATEFPYLVRVTISDLNYRKGPSTSYETYGYIEPGVYTIVDEKDGWGLLKAYADKRNGWISLKYATRI